jgi:hypothetical protein
MRLSKATGLTDLAEEYAFFTTGILHVHGRLDYDPVATYVQEYPNCCPMRINLPTPAFKGLNVGDNDVWNYVIFAVRKEEWGETNKKLMQYLSYLGIVDRKRNRYSRMLVQELPMLDRLALARKSVLPSPLPSVNIFTFGLDGNKERVFFEPAFDMHPKKKIRVVKLGPDEAGRQFAEHMRQRAFTEDKLYPEKQEIALAA